MLNPVWSSCFIYQKFLAQSHSLFGSTLVHILQAEQKSVKINALYVQLGYKALGFEADKHV